MRKLSALLAFVLFAATATVASAAVTWTQDFGPGRDATQAGTLVIEDMGNNIKVTLTMTAMAAEIQQPAHIHVGSCPGVGAVAYPLTNVVAGKSETTVNVKMADLFSKQHSINVHKSSTEAGVYTACAELPAGALLGLKAGRDATQAGVVILDDLRNGTTEVHLVMDPSPGGAAVQQPAHIHVGGCPGVGAVAFPLSNVVNGSSRTVVNASLATIQARQHAINVHKSAAEVAVYTACVDIPLMQQAPVAAPTQLPRTGGAPLALVALMGIGLAGVGTALRRR